MAWYKTGPMQGVSANVNPNLNLLKPNFNLSNPTKLDRKLADYSSLTLSYLSSLAAGPDSRPGLDINHNSPTLVN